MNTIANIFKDIALHVYTYTGSSVIMAVLTMISLMYINDIGIGAFTKKVMQNIRTNKKMPLLFLWLVFTFMILNRALIGRNTWVNPWQNIIGQWTLQVGDDFNFDFVENILLFIPETFLLLLCDAKAFCFNSPFKGIVEVLKIQKNEQVGDDKVSLLMIFRNTAAVSLSLSVFIECSQLFLKIGTFQLSDIFCNILGGLIGGIAYYICYVIKLVK